MSNVYFDHCYTLDQDFKFLKKLEKIGFTLGKSIVEHPGKHICRFIHFYGNTPRRFQYLEFVSVGRGGKPVKQSGISFGHKGNLEEYYKQLKSKKNYSPKFDHRNYDWKTDSKSKLVGWDFVSFKKHGLSHLYPWFTAYGVRPGSENTKWKIQHKVGKVRLVGLTFMLSKKGEAFVRHILGKGMKLSCGVAVDVIPAKKDRQVQILLEVEKFDLVAKHADEVFYVNAKRYALIKNPSGMWNILIKEAN